MVTFFELTTFMYTVCAVFIVAFFYLWYTSPKRSSVIILGILLALSVIGCLLYANYR